MSTNPSQPYERNITQYPRILPVETISTIVWIFAATAVLLTIGQLIYRWRKSLCFYIDDSLNTLAASLLIPFLIAAQIFIPIEYDSLLFILGLRDEPPPANKLSFSVKMELVTLLLFFVIVYMVKASALSLFWRIHSHSHTFRVAWWATTIFVAISFGISFMGVFWECGSPTKIGNKEACNNVDVSIVMTLIKLWCSLNIITYILVLVLPLPMVMSKLAGLGMSHWFGLALMISFVLSCIALETMRTVWYLKPSLRAASNLVVVWTLLEPSIAVIASSLLSYERIFHCEEQNLPLRIKDERTHSSLELRNVGN